MRDEKDYAGMPADKLREELVSVTRNLASYSYTLARQQVDEHDQWILGYQQSEDKSVAGRKAEADVGARMLHNEALETAGQVAFLTITRETIIILLRTIHG